MSPYESSFYKIFDIVLIYRGLDQRVSFGLIPNKPIIAKKFEV